MQDIGGIRMQGSVVTSEVPESSKINFRHVGEERKRPVGISILAVINMIGAALMAVAAIGIGTTTYDPTVAGAAGAILAFLSIGGLLIALGLWKLHNWARITAIVLYSISAVSGLIEGLSGNSVRGIPPAYDSWAARSVPYPKTCG